MKFFNRILKWLAVFLFSLTAGLLVIIFLSGAPQITAFWLRIFMLLAIGFTGGLFMRLLFHKGFALIQILIAWITNTASVLLIDYFYDSEYFLSFLTENFQFIVPSTSDIAQLIALLLISLVPIVPFRRKKKLKKIESVQSKPKGQSFSDRVKEAAHQANPKNWNIKLPAFSSLPSAARKNENTSAKIQASARASTSKGRVKHIKTSASKNSFAKKIKLPSFKKNHLNNDVKLMGEEEHVCPYCLEEVKKNDSRGVVICPECGTWHHKDCWDVTGSCGIAHRNKL
ncbi:MAG: hypothetical protein J7L66_01935 [Anaerolineaceae bacterium]|nr:hypothetical protein [Anaerolineaceae bacterium]